MFSTLMDYGTIRGIERPVPRLIQGTRLLPLEDRDACNALFDTAFDAGCNAVETAIVYHGGEAERVVGDWMNLRRVRESMIVIAKGCHPSNELPRMNPSALQEDVRMSLDRLKTDYIDLYLLHRDDPTVPVGEILSALHDEVSAGRIRAFGASNWSHERIQLALDYSRENGACAFAASSPGFSLLEALDSWPGCISLQFPADRGAFEWYAKSRLPLLAWSPLASGFLSGRYTRENLCEFEAPFDRQTIRFYASEANFQRLERLVSVAAARKISLPRAALAYVLSFPLDTYAILGCRNAREFLDCAAALEARYSDVELGFLHGERTDFALT